MATSSGMTVQLNKVTCPICCDRFKVPKVLQCGHSFCETCVHQLFQSTPASCPVCREEVSTWNTSAEQLPTNYVLQALVDSDTCLFDKESLCRSFGECSSHEDVCDQFCITCERQVCKQCISEHHQGSSHDSSPVGTVVVQQREVLDKLIIDLGDLMKRLKLVEANITESKKTCHSEVDQLNTDINTSITEWTDNIVSHAESLHVVVEEEKLKILQYLESLKLKHSESFLLASLGLDLCHSLHADLDKNNLSRVAVMKRLTENKRKIEEELENLEGKEDALKIEFKFQPITIKAKAGELESKKSSIPVASYMKRVSFTDNEVAKTDVSSTKTDVSSTKEDVTSAKADVSSKSTGLLRTHRLQRRHMFPLGTSSHSKPTATSSHSEPTAAFLGFLWPIPTWMIALTPQAAGSHNFVKFTNLHFLQTTFYHEIGVDKMWLHVSHCDYEGKFILCVSWKRVHKFSLPLKQNLQEPGKLVSMVFTPKPILGIAWDEIHRGCYALLNDKKTLLHVEFGGPEGFKEVTVFEEEITSHENTHFFHVNEEGSMAICDHGKKVVHFFEKVEAKPTVTISAPANLKEPTPESVNTRRGEKLWYVMWKESPLYSGHKIKLYVYDSSFQLIGQIPNLCVDIASNARRVMFCFQGDYIAVTIDDKVDVYVLS